MLLKWLTLSGFRSYSSLEWAPDEGVNILVGDNGAGKTNLLEGVGYLSTLRSFRSAPDEALVANGEDTAVLRGEADELLEVEIRRRGGRRTRVAKKPVARSTDVLSVLRVVTFLPEDLDLIKGGPGGRRDFLDDVAVQLWPAAALDQAEFDRSLRQRNAFLKHGERDIATLEVWDARLAQAAARVMSRRARAAQMLEPPLTELYSQIAGTSSEVGFSYLSEWGGSLDPTTPAAEWSAALLAALAHRRRVDFELRSTGAGPHRDEPAILLTGESSRYQASQGEQRTLALTLRLATHRTVTEQVGRMPLLLLDDVYSELDHARAKSLTDALPAAQTFISTTRPEEVPLHGRAWQVGHGTIAQLS
ncbi:MAG: DNA replication/repair protein RecF [Acidimicrobiia bacterium]|nr:DNA replication/repair protein RecF [Acidimicrobiia bacterium]MDQ3500056.1 DNA replication/repair protein RecF [Actinomycetota bacterium]